MNGVLKYMKNKKKIIICITLIVCTALAIIIYNENSVTKSNKTIFIYMCGSNLETKKGLAGKNIDEILSAKIGDNVSIIIQTGGAQEWKSHDIKNNKIQRYEIKDGELKLIKTLDNSNMGEGQTLTDFLKWGQKKYKSEHYMLVLWDHGAGPLEGVAFDENYDFDALSLMELKTALNNANLTKKLDIIGFDACLMASIETASYVQNFANYMIASEEIEPSGGWNYKVLVESYAKQDDLVEVGKNICDAYIEKCKNKEKLYATLSLLDLSQTNYAVGQFSKVAEYLDNYVDNADYSSTVIDAMNICEKFGGDNSYQGASNMLDFVDFVSKATNGNDENKIQFDFSPFVLYAVNSSNRNTGGFSFYYPMVYDEQEIKDYINLGVSEYYNKFLSLYYLNLPEKTIEYKNSGRIEENGAFSVELTLESNNYLSRVDYLLMKKDENNKQHILHTDNDITKDWENLFFKSNFKGTTVALDEHKLFYTTTSSDERHVSYSSPVKVNGERTNLKFVFVRNETIPDGGYYMLVGLWKGYDENGLPDNDIVSLQKGDIIQVVTDVVIENGKTIENYSEEFTISDNGGKITELPLDGKEYQYVFAATDIFGNTYTSDIATLEMTISYDELLKNPLPDEIFAAKVTNIEKYTK